MRAPTRVSGLALVVLSQIFQKKLSRNRLYPRQLFSLQKLQHGAAAGTDQTDFFSEFELAHCLDDNFYQSLGTKRRSCRQNTNWRPANTAATPSNRIVSHFFLKKARCHSNEEVFSLPVH